MTSTDLDVIIVGAGAAGLSAALMLGRSRRRVLVLDDTAPRNRYAAHMHGVLGHDGTAPGQLLAAGRAECARYGVEFSEARVSEVTESDQILVVRTEAGATYTAARLIAATGVVDELPDIPGLRQRWGSSVLHCPYCHGWEVADQHFGVLATSPMSVHQAQLIRQWSDRVTLFTNGAVEVDDSLRARLESRGIGIESEPVTAITGSAPGIDGLTLTDGRTVPVEVIFTGGILRPRADYLAGLDLDQDELPFGTAISAGATGRTSHRLIWAVGNLSQPMANVPVAMAAGTTAGAHVNGDLVEQDFDQALLTPA